MPLQDIYPLANGLRTDHPIPDLPFVDDSHIPVHDGPGVEAIGRHHGTGTWGRHDRTRDGGWVAFTTDSIQPQAGWVVRWHPEFGRSVTLYSDNDAASVHSVLDRDVLLFRAGGYWWDGVHWYRPSQIFDRASENYVRRRVPAAATVTAADLLQTGGEARRGRVYGIDQIDPDTSPPVESWLDDLAAWAASREDGARPLAACVVAVSAPELGTDQLIGLPQVAQIGGLAPSTLRAYISRKEGDVPQPQARFAGGRSMWARPVAQEWAELRNRSSENVRTAVSTQVGELAVTTGLAEIWATFTRLFKASLWDDPANRKRWALRWRTPAAVDEVARGLGWQVAAGLESIVPFESLGVTVRQAFLDEFATAQEGRESVGAAPLPFYGISRHVAKMLDWLIRHKPSTASYTISEIIGEAERRLHIPREVCEHSIATALSLDGQLDRDAREEFLGRVFTPVGDRPAPPPVRLT